MPNYLISYSDHKVVLRNYEGYITTYEEPEHYQAHDKANCKYCQSPRAEAGQGGITGLLSGERLWIEPSGFEQTHRRGNESAHRLQDPSKWVPYGVGPIEGKAGQPLAGIEAGSTPPETSDAASTPGAPREPTFEYAPARSPARARAKQRAGLTASCSRFLSVASARPAAELNPEHRRSRAPIRRKAQSPSCAGPMQRLPSSGTLRSCNERSRLRRATSGGYAGTRIMWMRLWPSRSPAWFSSPPSRSTGSIS